MRFNSGNMMREVHNINIWDITKDFVDSKYPVIHSDKNGFLLCRKGHFQLSLDDNVFDINAGDLYIYPPLCPKITILFMPFPGVL